jgi:FG-GAP repeat
MPRRARIAVGNYQRNQLTGSEAFMLEIGQRIAERILFAHAADRGHANDCGQMNRKINLSCLGFRISKRGSVSRQIRSPRRLPRDPLMDGSLFRRNHIGERQNSTVQLQMPSGDNAADVEGPVMRALSRCNALVVLCVLLSSPSLLRAQSPILSADGIGPSTEEAGTSDPFPSPRFGETVAISARTAMASLPGDLASEPNEYGRVAVFDNTKQGWKRTATLIGTEESGGDFGRAIDIEGDHAVIAGAKAIYLFERRGHTWKQSAAAVLHRSSSYFGHSVELEHGLIVARVYDQEDVPVTRSAVHVYATNESHHGYGANGTANSTDNRHADRKLSRVAILHPQDGSDSTSFGADISMDGPLLVIGAPDGGDIGGSAYVFLRWGNRWLQIARLMANDSTVQDGFGASVAIRRGVIVVGAPNADLGLPDDEAYGPVRGNVYVFLPSRGGWYQSQQLNALGDENAIRDLGHQVRLGRDLLAVRVPDLRGIIRGEDRVFVYDWEDRLFQFPHRVARYEGFIPDIDMSGRQLILSQHDAGIFTYYVRGSATIYRFGPSATAAEE